MKPGITYLDVLDLPQGSARKPTQQELLRAIAAAEARARGAAKPPAQPGAKRAAPARKGAF